MRPRTILAFFFLVSLGAAATVGLVLESPWQEAQPKADEAARPEVYGAALRGAVIEDFGAALLYPGDRVDVILTQKISDSAPLARRSVSKTVAENLRVRLIIDTTDAKTAARYTFGRIVTLEVMPEQAEKINVATKLGKFSLTLHSLRGFNDYPLPFVLPVTSAK